MRHYDRLDAALNAARLERRLSWKEFADVAGISDVSLRNFRKGRSELNSLSKRRIEDAAGWAHGSVDAILAGGEPAASTSAELDELEDLRRTLTAALEQLDRLQQKAH